MDTRRNILLSGNGRFWILAAFLEGFGRFFTRFNILGYVLFMQGVAKFDSN